MFEWMQNDRHKMNMICLLSNHQILFTLKSDNKSEFEFMTQHQYAAAFNLSKCLFGTIYDELDRLVLTDDQLFSLKYNIFS